MINDNGSCRALPHLNRYPTRVVASNKMLPKDREQPRGWSRSHQLRIGKAVPLAQSNAESLWVTPRFTRHSARAIRAHAQRQRRLLLMLWPPAGTIYRTTDSPSRRTLTGWPRGPKLPAHSPLAVPSPGQQEHQCQPGHNHGNEQKKHGPISIELGERNVLIEIRA